MTKTLIDLNNDLLMTAQAALGTVTKKETVNQSLGQALRVNAIEGDLRATALYERDTPGLVLVDASVVVHCATPAVAARLVPLLVMDDLATCAAVRHEMASVPDDPALGAWRRVTLRWLPTDDADLARASQIQAQLTELGEPAFAWSRLVVAAVAMRHSAMVLHYASDFDLIAKVTGQDAQWVAPPGMLSGATGQAGA